MVKFSAITNQYSLPSHYNNPVPFSPGPVTPPTVSIVVENNKRLKEKAETHFFPEFAEVYDPYSIMPRVKKKKSGKIVYTAPTARRSTRHPSPNGCMWALMAKLIGPKKWNAIRISQLKLQRRLTRPGIANTIALSTSGAGAFISDRSRTNALGSIHNANQNIVASKAQIYGDKYDQVYPVIKQLTCLTPYSDGTSINSPVIYNQNTKRPIDCVDPTAELYFTQQRTFNPAQSMKTATPSQASIKWLEASNTSLKLAEGALTTANTGLVLSSLVFSIAALKNISKLADAFHIKIRHHHKNS
jgi:hypothetical protein